MIRRFLSVENIILLQPELVVFLKANGYTSVKTAMEEAEMVLRAAAGEITEDAWTACVVRSVGPLR